MKEAVFILLWLWLPDQAAMRDHEGPMHYATKQECEKEARFRHPPPLWRGEAPAAHLCLKLPRAWAEPPR
jgi:hypothetical protein